MIECISHRILLRPDDVLKEKYKTDIPGFVVAGDAKEREQKGVDKGVVVGFGPTAFKDYGLENPLKIGDTLVFAKFAGKPVVDPDCPDEMFVVINDEDAIAIVTKKE